MAFAKTQEDFGRCRNRGRRPDADGVTWECRHPVSGMPLTVGGRVRDLIMKMIKILLVIVLGTALQATAAPAPQNFVSQAAGTNFLALKLMSWQPATKEKIQIERAGKMSSRPWTEIVGWHPGISQFPDAENHESQLTLLSVSFGSQNHKQPAISGRTPQR